jgi:hypothetical protein
MVVLKLLVPKVKNLYLLTTTLKRNNMNKMRMFKQIHYSAIMRVSSIQTPDNAPHSSPWPDTHLVQFYLFYLHKV